MDHLIMYLVKSVDHFILVGGNRGSFDLNLDWSIESQRIFSFDREGPGYHFVSFQSDRGSFNLDSDWVQGYFNPVSRSKGIFSLDPRWSKDHFILFGGDSGLFNLYPEGSRYILFQFAVTGNTFICTTWDLETFYFSPQWLWFRLFEPCRIQVYFISFSDELWTFNLDRMGSRDFVFQSIGVKG